MRIINLFFILLFVSSAALQYNDPDPVLWMAMYLYGAFLCWQSLKQRFSRWLFVAGLAVYLTMAVYLFVDDDGVMSWIRDHRAENIVQSMKATKPWIEETREFFGLMLLMAALVINYIWLNARAGKELIIKKKT